MIMIRARQGLKLYMQYYNYRLSFLNSPEFYEEDSLFHDYDHLNLKGSIKLTRSLDFRLKNDLSS